MGGRHLRELFAEEPLPAGPVTLEIEGNPWTYFFHVRERPGKGDDGRRRLSKARSKLLSTEVAGGFTGMYFALYATGGGQAASTPAVFEWFEYEPLPAR